MCLCLFVYFGYMFYLRSFTLFYFKLFCCVYLFIDCLLFFMAFLFLFFLQLCVELYIFWNMFVDGLFVCFFYYFLPGSSICIVILRKS